MKILISCCLLLRVGALLCQPAAPAQSITGKVICGYQGWFNAFGDGSPVERWVHWSRGVYQSNSGAPAPGNITFEAYPDLTDYPASTLFQTGLGNLNSGTPARLFSSWKPEVIDLHFRWMKDAGIDGIALQRFIAETFDGVFKTNRDSVAARVKRSAETHQRVFYLMYDMSGLDAARFDSVKSDWQHNMVARLQLTNSPYYLHHNNQPVVAIWGIGFVDRPGTPAQYLDLINWFKSQGCFVVGGVPAYWRTGTGDSQAGFLGVYQALDMLSPWTVGRFGNNTEADVYRDNVLVPDAAFCNANGILYQPVIFPGFAWSNWNGGPRNAIARAGGNFMWRQVYNIRQAGIGNAYVAMFDEYDEGTAVTRMADSYFDVPSDQYFLTTSADGQYRSPDFYMRLTGKVTRVIRGEDPLTVEMPVPASAGPVWFRTSFENEYDALPEWVDNPDPSIPVAGISGYAGSASPPECSAVPETGYTGTWALRYAGRDASASSSRIAFRVFQVNIPVSPRTRLTYYTFPQNNLARYVTVDLVMSDGSSLRTSGALDTAGVPMQASSARGAVNTWNRVRSDIGMWLNGKTIERILVSYDRGPETGDFRGYVDDIVIAEGKDPVYIFSGNGNWNIPGNWVNGLIPPADLTQGSIFINPQAGGECVLNGQQRVANKQLIMVNAGKRFRITGNLQVQN